MSKFDAVRASGDMLPSAMGTASDGKPWIFPRFKLFSKLIEAPDVRAVLCRMQLTECHDTP